MTHILCVRIARPLCTDSDRCPECSHLDRQAFQVFYKAVLKRFRQRKSRTKMSSSQNLSDASLPSQPSTPASTSSNVPTTLVSPTAVEPVPVYTTGQSTLTTCTTLSSVTNRPSTSSSIDTIPLPTEPGASQTTLPPVSHAIDPTYRMPAYPHP